MARSETAVRAETNGHVGHVRVVKRDAHTGNVLFDGTFKNQIQTYALQQAAAMWAGQYVPPINQIQVGTGSPPSGQTGTTPNDGGLWTPLAGTRLTVDYADVWLSVYTQWSVTYDQTQCLGTISSSNPNGQITLTEAALLDATGACISHVILNGVTHDNQSTLMIQWQVLQQGN